MLAHLLGPVLAPGTPLGPLRAPDYSCPRVAERTQLRALGSTLDAPTPRVARPAGRLVSLARGSYTSQTSRSRHVFSPLQTSCQRLPRDVCRQRLFHGRGRGLFVRAVVVSLLHLFGGVGGVFRRRGFGRSRGAAALSAGARASGRSHRPRSHARHGPEPLRAVDGRCPDRSFLLHQRGRKPARGPQRRLSRQGTALLFLVHGAKCRVRHPECRRHARAHLGCGGRATNCGRSEAKLAPVAYRSRLDRAVWTLWDRHCRHRRPTSGLSPLACRGLARARRCLARRPAQPAVVARRGAPVWILARDQRLLPLLCRAYPNHERARVLSALGRRRHPRCGAEPRYSRNAPPLGGIAAQLQAAGLRAMMTASSSVKNKTPLSLRGFKKARSAGEASDRMERKRSTVRALHPMRVAQGSNSISLGARSLCTTLRPASSISSVHSVMPRQRL